MFNQQDAPLKVTDQPMLGDAMLWTQPQPDQRGRLRRAWQAVLRLLRQLRRRLG